MVNQLSPNNTSRETVRPGRRSAFGSDSADDPAPTLGKVRVSWGHSASICAVSDSLAEGGGTVGVIGRVKLALTNASSAARSLQAQRR